jgi:glycosyltransferase involved in cell wall biosynthesis
VRVIPNGIDFERMRPSTGDARQRLRGELGLGDDLAVLVVARLHAEKGYDHLFEALPEIRRRTRQPFRLLIAGEGPLRAAYEGRVRALGCGDVVRFLGFRKDIADLMIASDVFLLPSIAEAFGLALVEALYEGLPVVATRVGGIPEIVDDGIDGILIPPASADAIAGAVAELLSNPTKRAELAGKGRNKVVEKFSFEKMLRECEAVYSELWGRLSS